MPSYGSQIPVDDRWAIVAYVRALQRSAAHARLRAHRRGAREARRRSRHEARTPSVDLSHDTLELGAVGAWRAGAASPIGVAGFAGVAALAADGLHGRREGAVSRVLPRQFRLLPLAGVGRAVLRARAARHARRLERRRCGGSPRRSRRTSCSRWRFSPSRSCCSLRDALPVDRYRGGRGGSRACTRKAAWLNVPFFLAPDGLLLRRLVGARDLVPPEDRPSRTERATSGLTHDGWRRSAPAALILFAFTVTFFAFDFLMSLTPHWYSTIFGVYFFAGCVLGFFALLSVLARPRAARGGAAARDHRSSTTTTWGS